MKYLIGIIMVFFSINASAKRSNLDFKYWDESGGWGIYNRKPEGYFNPLKIKKYKENYIRAFNYAIKVFEKQKEINYFCLIGYDFYKKDGHDEFKRVVVYWKTANRLINWEVPDGDDDNDDRYKSIIFSKPFIDINEYVVPYKEAEGAQALWAKEGVIQILDDCELHGEKITIKPSEVVDIK
ncbi:hypothetical protein [Xenorhabdus innexi]|uniref:Uncharacterized protein n=1 Tax=Xenorhabdus innexi TaxID=290109 RepID=A0A1N6MRH6_9GAMM|nr:hypothetical protein [Xenorhabdus innexi]PHM35631.1 hypothetical protein Xinn_02195 [Xenorhabdus innexi]SIP71359.1 conserved exported hypothetical protein [Xenorhabdus innexi]